MKRLIISIIMIITIFSLPVLSQSNQTASVNVNCLGNSLILPDFIQNTEIEPLQVNESAVMRTLDVPIEIIWTFKGDGTVPVHHVLIQQWDKVQDADLNNGEYIEIDSRWYADGLTGKEEKSNTNANTQFDVRLSKPGAGYGSTTGCDAEGKIYLKITGAKVTSHFPSNMGPVVFTFVIAAID